tara:strand:- start:4970 stop:5125 length:156 start_codon:yes stop_codon:yes gene_type:complete
MSKIIKILSIITVFGFGSAFACFAEESEPQQGAPETHKHQTAESSDQADHE